MLTVIDCDQGSDTWFQARRGIPTSSMFSAVLAKGEGKTRKSYMHKLVAEIITGDIGEGFQSQAMERGKILEDEARDLYAFVRSETTLERVGFIRNGCKGASPDSLIGVDGGLEIKTQRADLLVETLLKNEMPPEHKAQIQGNIWVSERTWWDIVVYWPKMPLFIKRVFRDDSYIANLSIEVDRFNDELVALVEKIKAYS